MSKFPITECPKCGSKYFSVKQYISGYGSYIVNLEDGEVDCDGLYGGLKYKNASKYAVCAKCGKRLFKIDSDLNVMILWMHFVK